MQRPLALLAAVLSLLPIASASAVPPPVEGAAALVANGSSGEILWGRNADVKLSIASVTKVMTALVTLQQTDPDDRVRVSARASRVGEATAELRAGEMLTVRDLLEALLIESANDAANALADHVGGERGLRGFVTEMNARADELGMAETEFRRADGLDTPGHLSSARDVLRMARAAMERPLFRRIVRMRAATIAGGRRVETTNNLLKSYRGLIGVKTGHTSDAGWCEVAAARRGNVVVYAVILGSPSEAQRDADLAKLLDWGFKQLGEVVLIDGRKVYATSAVPYRAGRPLELVADRAVRRVVRWGEPLVERVTAPAMIDPPVAAGDELGLVEIVDPETGDVVVSTPLIAAETVTAVGLGSRLRWFVRKAIANVPHVFGSVVGALF